MLTKNMAKGYKAVVLMRSDVASRIVASNESVARKWARLTQKERNPSSLKQKILGASVIARQVHFDTF